MQRQARIRATVWWVMVGCGLVALPAPASAQSRPRTIGVGAVPFMGTVPLLGDVTEQQLFRLMGETPSIARVITPKDPKSLFEQVVKLAGANRCLVDFLVIGGHGAQSTPIVLFPGSPLTLEDVNVPKMKQNLARCQESLARMVQEGRAQADMDKERAAILRLSERLQLLDAVASVMAPKATIWLLNCCAADGEAGEAFVKGIGSALLGKQGGAIVAAKGIVTIAETTNLLGCLGAYLRTGELTLPGGIEPSGKWVTFKIEPSAQNAAVSYRGGVTDAWRKEKDQSARGGWGWRAAKLVDYALTVSDTTLTVNLRDGVATLAPVEHNFRLDYHDNHKPAGTTERATVRQTVTFTPGRVLGDGSIEGGQAKCSEQRTGRPEFATLLLCGDGAYWGAARGSDGASYRVYLLSHRTGLRPAMEIGKPLFILTAAALPDQAIYLPSAREVPLQDLPPIRLPDVPTRVPLPEPPMGPAGPPQRRAPTRKVYRPSPDEAAAAGVVAKELDAGRVPDKDAMLADAVSGGYQALAGLLLARGARPEARTAAGESLLSIALRRDDQGMATLLLQAVVSAEIEKHRRAGAPPPEAPSPMTQGEASELTLMEHALAINPAADVGPWLRGAASHGSLTVVRKLLDRGARAGAADATTGDTPLHVAARGRSQAIAELLLAAGADARARNRAGESPLDIAKKAGDSALLATLIAGEAGNTAWNQAAAEAALSVPTDEAEKRALATLKAELPKLGRVDLAPYLVIAASNGHAAVAQFLLNREASVEAVNDKGDTVLQLAVLGNHARVAELLLLRGTNVAGEGPGKVAALHLAAGEGHADIARLLLRYGADVDVRDEGGRTPLHYAAVTGHTEVVELLLARKADLHARSATGDTALHYAAQKGRRRALALLLALGLDPAATNQAGMAPAQVAQDPEVAKFLTDFQKRRAAPRLPPAK